MFNRAHHSTDAMVFGGDFDENNTGGDPAGNEAAARIQAVRAANCIRILGKGVIRVVHRVDDARVNNNLGEGLYFYLQRQRRSTNDENCCCCSWDEVKLPVAFVVFLVL